MCRLFITAIVNVYEKILDREIIEVQVKLEKFDKNSIRSKVNIFKYNKKCFTKEFNKEWICEAKLDIHDKAKAMYVGFKNTIEKLAAEKTIPDGKTSNAWYKKKF